MNCPNCTVCNGSCNCAFVRDLYWKQMNKQTGVEYNHPYYLAQVPQGMGSNAVGGYTPRQWTNVRGYGNILTYTKLPNPLGVGYNVSPWNR